MSKLVYPPGSHLEALSDRIHALGNALVVQLGQKIAAGASSAEVDALQRSLMEPIDLLQDSLILEMGFPLSRARVRALRVAAQAQGVRQ